MNSTLKLKTVSPVGLTRQGFLSLGFYALPPRRLAGDPSLGKRVTDPPLMMSTHRHSGQAFAIHCPAQLWQWPHVKKWGRASL